jgi:hypothetical protein
MFHCTHVPSVGSLNTGKSSISFWIAFTCGLFSGRNFCGELGISKALKRSKPLPFSRSAVQSKVAVLFLTFPTGVSKSVRSKSLHDSRKVVNFWIVEI